jgi:tetratricopeptide (TPR) repeat protein
MNRHGSEVELLQLKKYHREGRAAYDAGDWRLSVQLFKQAIEGRERFGTDSDDIAETRRYYGEALYMAENYESAAEQFTLLVFWAERKFGRDHVQTAKKRRSLGYALKKCGHKGAAREQFKLAAQGFEMTSGGTDNIDSLSCRYEHGLLASSGEAYDTAWPHWAEAEESLQRAAQGLSRLLGAKDEQSFQALIEYARVLLKMRKDNAALGQFKLALSIAEARRMAKNDIQQIKGEIKECQFWLKHKQAQSPDRLIIARTRAEESKKKQMRRGETDHWSFAKSSGPGWPSLTRSDLVGLDWRGI